MSVSVSGRRLLQIAACWPTLALLAACSESRPAAFQGYVEGQFVNVAAPIAGRLEKVAVSETAAEREAQEQLRAAEARLADLKLGRRPAAQNVTAALYQALGGGWIEQTANAPDN